MQLGSVPAPPEPSWSPWDREDPSETYHGVPRATSLYPVMTDSHACHCWVPSGRAGNVADENANMRLRFYMDLAVRAQKETATLSDDRCRHTFMLLAHALCYAIVLPG